MVAVTTGGTRGIGLGIAKTLLKNGFSVVVSARKISEEIESLKEEYCGKVSFLEVRAVPIINEPFEGYLKNI